MIKKALSVLLALLLLAPVLLFSGEGSDPLSLALVRESKVQRLLGAQGDKVKFETSGITYAEGNLYCVFDNLEQIGRFGPGLPRKSGKNSLLGGSGGVTGLEGISYDPKKRLFYTVVESLPHKGAFRARVQLYDASLKPEGAYWLPFDLAGGNKGFEGLLFLHRGRDDFLLALCEGNRCKKGKKSRRPGGGRIQVFKRTADRYVHVTSVKLPASLGFADYSGMDLLGNRLAVVSQESAQMWVGTLDTSAWKVYGEGRRYHFPRNKKGKVIYCNVEGVAWVTPTRLATVTDRSKNSQPKRCVKKEASIQLFDLPE